MKNYSAKEHFKKIEEFIDACGIKKESIILIVLLELFERGGKKFQEKNKSIYNLIQKKVDRMGYDGDEEKFINLQNFLIEK